MQLSDLIIPVVSPLTLDWSDRELFDPVVTAEPAVTAELPAVSIADWVRDFSDFTKVRRLGKGSFGFVDLYKNDATGELIALKSVFTATRDLTEQLMRELEALIHFRHPCILPIIGYSHSTSVNAVRIGTEYAPHGDLAHVLEQRQSPDRPLSFSQKAE